MNAAMMLVCLASGATAAQPKTVFEAAMIEVFEREDIDKKGFKYNYLMFHRVYLGSNFHKPTAREDLGKPNVDLSRVPTTYFHDRSPVGVVLKQYDWFRDRSNYYRSDARAPASVAGMGVSPYANLGNLWTEPPVAVLGMDVGTLAAYARPAQTFHFTERKTVFIRLSLPEKKGATRYFHYVQDAMDRGALVKVYGGEPREMLAKHGGERFYQIIIIETYKMPVVEVHKELMTKEAVQMMLGKLREGGILCFHTSNRYYDLLPNLLNIAADLKCATIVGRDQTHSMDRIRFSSEWVMIARNKKDLMHLQIPAGYKDGNFGQIVPYWSRDEKATKKILWTDKGENSFRGIYRSDPKIDLLADAIRRGQIWFSDRTGLLHYPALESVYGALRVWSRRSADVMNGEILTKDRKDARKK